VHPCFKILDVHGRSRIFHSVCAITRCQSRLTCICGIVIVYAYGTTFPRGDGFIVIKTRSEAEEEKARATDTRAQTVNGRPAKLETGNLVNRETAIPVVLLSSVGFRARMEIPW
jgi:hypothetical protein